MKTLTVAQTTKQVVQVARFIRTTWDDQGAKRPVHLHIAEALTLLGYEEADIDMPLCHKAVAR